MVANTLIVKLRVKWTRTSIFMHGHIVKSESMYVPEHGLTEYDTSEVSEKRHLTELVLGICFYLLDILCNTVTSLTVSLQQSRQDQLYKLLC